MMEIVHMVGLFCLMMVGSVVCLAFLVLAWVWCISKIENTFLFAVLLLSASLIVSIFFVKNDILTIVYFIFVCFTTLTFATSLDKFLEKLNSIVYYSVFCLTYFGSVFCVRFFYIRNDAVGLLFDALEEFLGIVGVTVVVMYTMFIMMYLRITLRYCAVILDHLWGKMKKK